MLKLLIVFMVVIFCAACSNAPSQYCYQNLYQNITDYNIEPDAETALGIRVDTGGYAVDLLELDARITKIEKCIQRAAAENLMISGEEKTGWQCLRQVSPEEKLRRECLIIKVVRPVFSICSNWQFIGVKAPDEFCLDKGSKPKPECPCMWRTAIQDENIIITPPAMYLWEIGRIMTSCAGVWHSPYAKCLSF